MGHPRPNNSIVDSSALQRFDAPIGGPVTQVTTLISKWNQNETQPLNVAILTVGGSLPGTLLGVVSVAANQFSYPSRTETTFDFSTPGVELQAGESYFVAFTVEVRPWELVVYPRSDTRRSSEVTHGMKARK